MSERVGVGVWRYAIVGLLAPAVIVAVLLVVQRSEFSLSAPSPVGAGATSGSLLTAELNKRVALERSARDDVLTSGLIAVLVLVLSGSAGALFLRRRLASRGTGRDPRGEARDRGVLVRACVDVSDVVSSAALRAQLVDALADVGVTPIQVRAGERFDPTRHRAVDRVVTDDPALDDLVAETERPGYSDRGARLRLPEVLVYSAARGRHRGA